MYSPVCVCVCDHFALFEVCHFISVHVCFRAATNDYFDNLLDYLTE